VNSRVKKVPPLTYLLMGSRFSVRNGLYAGGAIVLFMAMTLLTAIHVYTAINPPTIVLAIQPGENQTTIILFYIGVVGPGNHQAHQRALRCCSAEAVLTHINVSACLKTLPTLILTSMCMPLLSADGLFR